MRAFLLGLVLTAAGCAVPGRPPEPVGPHAAARPPVSAVVPVGHPDAAPSAVPGAGAGPLGLPELIGLTERQNPRLAQVAWAVETARGRAVQAGLYPNPTVIVTGDELGDRQGPDGVWTAPYLQQEIVTGDKLALSRAAALKEVDQAALATVAERYRVFTDVRQNYFEVVALQKRAEILAELIGLAEQSVANAGNLLKAGEGSRLDVVQLEVDLERYRAERDAARRSLDPAFRRLAASVGVQDQPPAAVAGDLAAPPPDYDLDRVRAYVLGVHPDIRSAQVGVERARLVVQRATAEPVPNVTVGAGYVRQSQNRSDDWVVGASVPVPLFNRNQGGIAAAKGQLGEAINAVGRAQNDVAGRLAAAFTAYVAARTRAERYKAAILPRAEESYQLSVKAYQGGQFEYLRVLQAQRAVAEARLESLRAQTEQWRAASEVAGLMLEDDWPPAPVTPPRTQP